MIHMNLVTDRPHLQALSGVREELATPMRAALPALGDEVIAEIRDSVPEYAQPLEGRFGEAVRTGVGVALKRFVDDVERPGEDSEGWRAVYENLGRGEYRQGRTLEALLAAYRLGARVSWRRVADAATERRRHALGARGPGRGDLRLHRRALLASRPRGTRPSAPSRSRSASASARSWCAC